ncbi:IS3 family transposase [Paenibacillus thiaminolyticus]|uniref:IS3 family transposase n=1 Tax=Paenibacillus thiaminolyticus TaxID=49283 RepID=UPI003D6C94BB
MTHVMMSIYDEVDRIFGYRQLTLHIRSKREKRFSQKRVYRLIKIQDMRDPLHSRWLRTC